MEPRVRDLLHDLIRRFGHGVAEDPARCQAMLRDLCPAQRREINVLIAALREGVARDLLRPNPLPASMRITRLTQRLEADTGLAPEPACWAVQTWALVLGVIDGAAVAVRPEAPPVARPTPPPGRKPAEAAAPAPRRPASPPKAPAPVAPVVPDIHGWPADPRHQGSGLSRWH